MQFKIVFTFVTAVITCLPTIIECGGILNGHRENRFAPLQNIQTKTSAEVQTKAVKDLISRLLPDRAEEFDVVIEPGRPEEENGYFQITKRINDNVVYIKGSTGVLAAWGFHYYLTQYCRCQVSWDADQLNLPVSLPEASIRIVSFDKFRYHQNVCTVSYSYAWWQWPRWERDIDWMAMNGINLPLAFTGQEVIWQRVYLGLGLTQQDIDEHFSGPAFFAWQRMGNLRGWGGPLSDNWQLSTLTLQHQILDRMRSFGMIPVLPAFAGHIPRAIERVYPNASYTSLTPWLGFEDQYCCPSFLQPTEPLFTEIGSRFIQEMTSEFGTDHIYNCDVFNEVRPTESDPVFVSSVGQAVFNAMTKSDPDAIWLMQGWLFKADREFWTPELSRALLTSVPLGRMLLLDLQAEVDPQYIRLESFYGQPFIFCLLHNFGGTLGLYGVVPPLAQRVIDARKFPNSTMVGTGLTMEGIDQNYVVYDNMLEMGWRNEAPDLNNWFDDYTIRRYGRNNSVVMQAWRILQKSVYNAGADHFYRGRYTVISRRPSLVFKPSPSQSVYNDKTNIQFHGWFTLTLRPSLFTMNNIWYDPNDVILAWDGFIQASSSDPELSKSPNFQHDLIDVTRQSIQEMFHLFYSQLVISYKDKNITAFGEAARKILDVLDDLDGLLQSGHKFLLGKWISDSKSWGYTEGEKLQYEWNARNQITLWGPKGEILDYAVKQWAGVTADYFKPRWDLFIRELEISLDTGTAFNQSSYNTAVFAAVEQPFTFSTKIYSAEPIGDAVSIAGAIYNKWRQMYQRDLEMSSPNVRNLWRRGQRRPLSQTKKRKNSIRKIFSKNTLVSP